MRLNAAERVSDSAPAAASARRVELLPELAPFLVRLLKEARRIRVQKRQALALPRPVAARTEWLSARARRPAEALWSLSTHRVAPIRAA